MYQQMIHVIHRLVVPTRSATTVNVHAYPNITEIPTQVVGPNACYTQIVHVRKRVLGINVWTLALAHVLRMLFVKLSIIYRTAAVLRVCKAVLLLYAHQYQVRN